jgi:hypothetical protein
MMFPLAGNTFPTTAEQLRQSIQVALGQLLTFQKNQSAVTIDAPQYPHVQRLDVDLSGAKLIAKPPPLPKLAGKREKGTQVDQLNILGRPVLYESSKVNLQVAGRQITFDFAQDANGNALLIPTDAAEGNVDISVIKTDLRGLALAAARLAAKDRGVTIQDVDIELQSTATRAVSANIRVKAKKMLVSGVVRITGQLQLDDRLNATLSNLTCTGEGMIGNVVAGVVQPKLQGYNSKQIALMAFSLGDITLRDLKIDVKSGLHLTAAFGK